MLRRSAFARPSIAISLLSLAAFVAGCGAEPDLPSRGVWMRGDLHVHSNHSTDATQTMAEAVAKAESLGFDYFVVTDHDNHVDGMITTWDDPAYRSDTMTMLYGVEWTTAHGHANFFATAPWDHAPLYALREGVGADVVAAAHAQGLHFSINHPLNGDPWEYGFDLDADAMEVWNAMFLVPTDNDAALALWDSLLLEGRRITGRGGSDCHHQHADESAFFNMGNPTTWILAGDRSARSVIDALTAGHASVSYAPTAERIELDADADGRPGYEAIVGDSLPSSGATVRFRVTIAGFRKGRTYTVRVVKDGATFLETSLSSARLEFEDTPAANERAYYRVEVRGSTSDAPPGTRSFYGDFIGFTNPIYVGFP